MQGEKLDLKNYYYEELETRIRDQQDLLIEICKSEFKNDGSQTVPVHIKIANKKAEERKCRQNNIRFVNFIMPMPEALTEKITLSDCLPPILG